MLVPITSRQNTLFKQMSSLHSRQGREKHRLFLLEGVRLIEEALNVDLVIRHAVYSSYIERSERALACLERLREQGLQPQLFDDRLLRELAGTERPQGILIAAEIPEPSTDLESLIQSSRLLLLVDGVQDPGNLGTILRTALAFSVDAVILFKGTVDPYNEKVIRSAMGALFSMPLVVNQSVDDCLAKLKNAHAQIVVSCLADGAEDYHSAGYNSKLAIVVGNEGTGVTQTLLDAADLKVVIPISSQAESLNVAVATGILLAQISQQY